MYGACGIEALGHIVVLVKELATVRLVAQRPDDDTRLVAVAKHHAQHTRMEGITPFVTLGKSAIGRVEDAVTLDVGLVDEIETIFGTQVIPFRIVGIMATTHGIDICLLHQLDILQHALHRDGTSVMGVVLMAVDTLYLQRHAIDKKLPIAHLHRAEAEGMDERLHLPALAVECRHHELIADGLLGTPDLYGSHSSMDGQQGVGSGALAEKLPEDRGAVGSQQRNARGTTFCGPAQPQGEVEDTVTIVIGEASHQTEVSNTGARARLEIDMALDATVFPVVLIFKIGAVAEADDTHGETVVARTQPLRDVIQ